MEDQKHHIITKAELRGVTHEACMGCSMIHDGPVAQRDDFNKTVQ